MKLNKPNIRIPLQSEVLDGRKNEVHGSSSTLDGLTFIFVYSLPGRARAAAHLHTRIAERQGHGGTGCCCARQKKMNEITCRRHLARAFAISICPVPTMATERTDLSFLGMFIGPLFALGWLVYLVVSTEIRKQEGSKGL